MKSTLESQQKAADLLLRLGGVFTVLGMLLTFGAMTPAVFGGHLASIWWALSMITGLGLVLLLIGIRRASSARSRAARTFLEESQESQGAS